MGKLTGKYRKGVILALVIMMAVVCSAVALAVPETEFRLEMDNLNLQKGVSSNLVVSLANAQGAEVIGITAIENFDVLSQNSSTSINIVNGASSYKEDRHYTIIPKTTGQFALKATVEYNGVIYETNTLQVTVSEGSSGEETAESDLFIKTNLSKTEAYLGEKLIVTYELYTRYNIENYGFTDYTAFDGIIATDVPAEQLRNEYVYLGGARYAKYEAKKLVLDPIKAGAHIIPSFNMQVNVITDSGYGGLFGGFGGIFNSSQAVYLQTEEKELTIKSLPQAEKPKDYSGIVGQLHLEGNFSREVVDYGDSLLLTVTASGNCNLDGLKKIFTTSPPGFKVYETQKNTAESVTNNQYTAQKDFEIILVPEKTGAINIAPISISYFDPKSEKYRQAEIAGVTIEVLGEIPIQQSSTGVGQATSLETVKVTQVNYTDTNEGYFTILLNKQILFKVLIGLTALLIMAVVLIRLLIKRKQQDSVMKSLYRQLLATQDINEAYNLFSEIIKHRYNMSIKAIPKNAVLNGLPQPDVAAQVADIMDYMESDVEKEYFCLRDKVKGVYRIIC